MFWSPRSTPPVILSAVLVAVASLAITAETRADGPTGWYAAISGGPALFTDSDLKVSISDGSNNVVHNGETDFDAGFNILGAVGYDLGPVRIEGEAGFRKADVDSISLKSVTAAGTPVDAPTLNAINRSTRASGDVAVLSAMVNGWYDPEFGGKWLPYIGGGVGVARVDVDLRISWQATLNGTDLYYSVQGDDTVFAYQAGAGLGYPISDATTVIVGYRYFGTSDVKFTNDGDKTKLETGSHNVEIGLRFRF